jgi:hypothetical protein
MIKITRKEWERLKRLGRTLVLENGKPAALFLDAIRGTVLEPVEIVDEVPLTVRHSSCI